MNNKFSKNDLRKTIYSKLIDLSEKDIKALIEKEFKKPNSQIDMDYIDLCYDLLELKVKNRAQHKKRVPFRKPAKAFIAAAVAVIFAGTLAVNAQFNLGIPQKIAELVNGNAEVDLNLENADTTADGYALLNTDLAKMIENQGIRPVTFPEELTGENCTVTSIEVISADDTAIWLDISFEYNGLEGILRIEQQSKKVEESTGVVTIMDIVSEQMIQANGMDILIFAQEKDCVIKYKDNLTNYDITFNGDIDTAIAIAQSIK